MVSSPKEVTSFFKDILGFITHNFLLKFLSFVFALVLFFIVRTDKETVMEKIVKVKLVTLPGMTILGSNERYLNATLKTQNAFLSSPPTENELSGEVDITSNITGKINVKITKENFPHMPKNYFLFIDKPYIEVEVDKLVRKSLQIKPVIIGQPANGFVISNVKVNPEKVVFSGANHELSQTEFINTVPIDIEGIDKTLTTDASFDVGEKASLKSTSKFANVVVTVVEKN